MPKSPLTAALTALSFAACAFAQDGESLPPNQDLRCRDDKGQPVERQRYFLIGPTAQQKAPKNGYRLLLILPGGDGSAEFATFCRRIVANTTDERWIAAQLVAPHWSEEQAKNLVWPTSQHRPEEAEFTTEQFVAAVIRDVERRQPIDPEHVYAMAWSSSGPAAYAASLDPTIGLTGSFVAMSVFKPDQLPPLKKAKGHAYFVLHSPDDFIPIAMAKDAVATLAKNGAKTEFAEYAGGHGWQGDVYGNMRKGLAWLCDNHQKPDKQRLKEHKAAKRD